LELSVPRDRNGTFEPLIVPKGERHLDGFKPVLGPARGRTRGTGSYHFTPAA